MLHHLSSVVRCVVLVSMFVAFGLTATDAYAAKACDVVQGTKCRPIGSEVPCKDGDKHYVCKCSDARKWECDTLPKPEAKPRLQPVDIDEILRKLGIII